MLGGCTFPPYCCHHDHHCGCMYLPSPSLSKRAKASLNSAVCSSVSWSAILILIPDIWKIFWICKTHNAQMQNILVKMTLFWPLKAESYWYSYCVLDCAFHLCFSHMTFFCRQVSPFPKFSQSPLHLQSPLFPSLFLAPRDFKLPFLLSDTKEDNFHLYNPQL